MMWKGRKQRTKGVAILLVAAICSTVGLGDTGLTSRRAKAAAAQVQEAPTAGEVQESPAAATETPSVVESSAPTETPSVTETPAPTETPDPMRVDTIEPEEGAHFLDDAEVLTGLEVKENTTTSITLQWDEMAGMTSYLVYTYDFETQKYVKLKQVTDTSIVIENLKPGQEFYYTVAGYNEEKGEQSHFAEPIHTYTRPEAVPTFQFAANASTSITLAWEAVPSATGYLIYHAEGNGVEKLVGSTTGLNFKDTGLKSGTTYRYRIRTYYADEENMGEYSEKLSTTTLPAKPTINVRAGNKRVRISWKKLTGATGYRLYQYNGSNAVLVATITGNSSVTYVKTGLNNNSTYKFALTAYRTYKNNDFEGSKSKAVSIKPVSVGKTSTAAKLYKSKKVFLRSLAVKGCTFMKKKLIYAKSLILPGMKNTNVAEFACSSMVPQGLTFAGKYVLISAYDYKKQDNSVIYVMNKNTKKLLTTIILPNKTHAGGLAYDGKNVWICQSTTLRSIPFATIKAAAVAKKPYLEISAYATKNELGQQAATVTYYKNLLWVASYTESGKGYLGSYRIDNKASKPALTLCNRIKVTNRIQGIAFTSNGRLILSRSCQTNSSKRGYMHRLDIYKPNLSNASSGKIKLGKLKKKIDMPSMNEEIAISGKYLYVSFESSYFGAASKRVDRICAFKVAAVTK